jgi:hypothetical protein
MSRRITLLVLAASTALIATQASADPECFGETCRMPEMVEPPAAEPPEAHDAAAAEASAAAFKFLPAKALPQVAADPVIRPPVPMQNLADDASVPPLAPRPVKSLPAPMRVPTAAAPAPILETNAGDGLRPARRGCHRRIPVVSWAIMRRRLEESSWLSRGRYTAVAVI